MRTVDPELWSKNLRKPRIKASRYNKFGQHPGHKYETIFRASVVDATFEYFKNCSMSANRYIHMEDNSKVERFCYVCLLYIMLGLGVYVIVWNLQELYVTPPLVISSQSAEAFISDVAFPAVALCSNNIISKAVFNNYTQYLFNHERNTKRKYPFSLDDIEENIKQLGTLLMLTLPTLKNHNGTGDEKFDEFLETVEAPFNVTDMMYMLSPKCTSILKRCSWRGRLVACNQLFATRVTPLGFCCVFNSRYYPEDANNEPRVLDLTGQNYGLGFVIAETRDDFMYVRRNVFGAEMLLFEGSEYPLLEGGDVRLYPVPRNHGLIVNVKVLTQQADDDVKIFSEEWRGCRTSGPGQSWCLWNCRRRTAVALCGCVPYTLHAAIHHNVHRACMLRDMPCLNKHREKFMYLYPHTAPDDDLALSEELQDGLNCDECRVQCRRQLYTSFISAVQYKDKGPIFQNFLTKGLSLVNASAIRVFYNSEHHLRYTLDAYAKWYETFAKLSTQWTVVTGMTIIGAVELLYYCTFRWLYHFIRRTRLANLRTATSA